MKKGSRLFKLDPYLDDEGLLAVGGCVRKVALPIDLRHPSSKRVSINAAVHWNYHEQCQHQGTGITLTTIC